MCTLCASASQFVFKLHFISLVYIYLIFRVLIVQLYFHFYLFNYKLLFHHFIIPFHHRLVLNAQHLLTFEPM